MKTVYSSVLRSEVGNLHLFADDNCLLGVYVNSGVENAQKRFRTAQLIEQDTLLLKNAVQQLNDYLMGKRTEFDIPLRIEGTDFEKLAWSALQKIPYGTTWSYHKQAQSAGRPTSVRAIASANGRNPFSIIIPCHRVIRSTGHLGGYSGGLDVKRQLLKIEGSYATIRGDHGSSGEVNQHLRIFPSSRESYPNPGKAF